VAEGSSESAVRIDRWLWAARLFRSRSLAAQACDGGKVDVNGHAVKPHKAVRSGDLVEVTLPVTGKRKLRVVGVTERRGPATAARLLYEDLTPPPPPREVIRDTLPRRERGSGRPTKRDRRHIDRFRDW